MSDDLKKAALEYHRLPNPGKLGIHATKPLANQRDLALAYSPGVAYACEAIVEDPAEAATVTSRSNLVGVITNGTAVLGLGAIGPLASKPVMEGKAVLFKKFAGIDVFDIEVDSTDPEHFCNVVAALEPTFGGINLEDIKAPECFEIEAKLRERMNIPVFHDDQHGTAIIVTAAITNALRVVGKDLTKVRLVTSGAGAAALACLDLLVSMGMPRENIWVTDIKGVVFEGRTELMDPRKAQYAQKTDARTLGEIIEGADIFLGLSAPGVLKPEFCAKMAKDPVIMALANPTPEIMPDEAKAIRPDALMGTGRSDFPNQVNNVLCFPFIFRGALDVGATGINEEMKIACVNAIAEMARRPAPESVASAYGGEPPSFGPEYLIPKPFDPRLIQEIPIAVAKAAMESGVATRPITDFDAYQEKLDRFVFQTGFVMKPIFEKAKSDPKRVVFAEGEEERVLRAVQTVIAEGLAKPILIGRRDVVNSRIEKLGLQIRLDENAELCDPQDDPRYPHYWRLYHEIMERRGVSPADAKDLVRTRPTVIGALMVKRGEADAMICGTVGRYSRHLNQVLDVVGLRKGVKGASAVTATILPKGTFFITDTHVRPDPTPEEIAEQTILAAEEVRRFGLEPKIALLSHSSFGARETPSADKMRKAMYVLDAWGPDLMYEGEMHADAAVHEVIRQRLFPNSRLTGAANLLVMPNLDAANIAFNLLKGVTDTTSIGPILLGLAEPVHVVTAAISVRGIVNMTSVAVTCAQSVAEGTAGAPEGDVTSL
ncbi:MAG: NADP-dependent malic enzyme [Pseudomonadota bacterium]